MKIIHLLEKTKWFLVTSFGGSNGTHFDWGSYVSSVAERNQNDTTALNGLRAATSTPAPDNVDSATSLPDAGLSEINSDELDLTGRPSPQANPTTTPHYNERAIDVPMSMSSDSSLASRFTVVNGTTIANAADATADHQCHPTPKLIRFAYQYSLPGNTIYKLK